MSIQAMGYDSILVELFRKGIKQSHAYSVSSCLAAG